MNRKRRGRQIGELVAVESFCTKAKCPDDGNTASLSRLSNIGSGGKFALN
jgi:hypothetical protein